jgi:hypothetical protein
MTQFRLSITLILCAILSMFLINACAAQQDIASAGGFECDSVVVHYLNWDLRTRVRVSAEDVRAYDSRKYFYVVNQKSDIENLIKSLSIIKFEFVRSASDIDVRMVLDFYHGGIIYSTVTANSFKMLFLDGNIYRSVAFMTLIDDIVPPGIGALPSSR